MYTRERPYYRGHPENSSPARTLVCVCGRAVPHVSVEAVTKFAYVSSITVLGRCRFRQNNRSVQSVLFSQALSQLSLVSVLHLSLVAPKAGGRATTTDSQFNTT